MYIFEKMLSIFFWIQNQNVLTSGLEKWPSLFFKIILCGMNLLDTLCNHHKSLLKTHLCCVAFSVVSYCFNVAHLFYLSVSFTIDINLLLCVIC